MNMYLNHLKVSQHFRIQFKELKFGPVIGKGGTILALFLFATTNLTCKFLYH